MREKTSWNWDERNFTLTIAISKAHVDNGHFWTFDTWIAKPIYDYAREQESIIAVVNWVWM